MTDRPILFSGPMVRALLAGTKTQTRRVLETVNGSLAPGQIIMMTGPRFGGTAYRFKPRYSVGDRLYVREEYYQYGHWEPVAGRLTAGGRQKWAFVPDDPAILFSAPQDVRLGRHHEDPGASAWHKRLGRFMPRAASRTTLTVSDVRVERLQNISEADAIAEGIEDVTREVASGDPTLRFWKRYRDGSWNGYVDTAVGSYASLWTEINGPGSWEANPFVAAYTFTVALGNIDQIRRTA